jgi:ADP-heptose:LPS heptosyltransferase
MWPIEKYAQLALHILRTCPGTRIELLGGPRDINLGRRLELIVGEKLIDKIGKTTLEQFVDSIGAADLVITNDSSAYHIAMAFGTKVLCFLGGGHFGWFAPYPATGGRAATARVLYVPMDCYWCNWKCRFPRTADGAVLCVDSISVASAIESLDALLAVAAPTRAAPICRT